jgi:GT2 family glycosyltransferase
MRLAYRHTSGGPRDQVALLNPDLCFLPGSVGELMDYLEEHRDCGAVDPRAYMDTAEVVHMPRNLLPTVLEHVRIVAARMGGALARAYSASRTRANLPWWEAEGPLAAAMLSGCCVFLRREVVEELGGPMDEAFPLYFEDTDLFRRLARLGYRVVHHGGARVVHHWSRSSGVGTEFEGEPHRRFLVSQRVYFERYYGRLAYRFVRLLDLFADRWLHTRWFRPMHRLVGLGQMSEPVEILLPRSCEFVLEVAMTPTWSLAAGVLGRGERWRCPAETWEWLFQGDYFLRALDRRSGELLGAWTFQKVAPGRSAPVSAEELRSLRGEVGRLAGEAAG